MTRQANLQAALANIEKYGHGCQTCVPYRAIEIREAVAAGNFMLAEEIAVEIEQLQWAECMGFIEQEFRKPTDKWEFWQLTAEAWARSLPHAYRSGRMVRVPKGSSRQDALNEFIRTYTGKNLSMNDFFHAKQQVAA